MSSQPWASSPISPSVTRRRRSKFTYKHLSTLSQCSTTCPLRVIAHIDLDAFYAQCETVRLGIDPGKPLAVQQWQGLIAINYPARAYGLGRHVTITEAKEKCPELICQHVATWKEGSAKWSYSDGEDGDAAKEIAVRKVSLDPYRIQSRKILALIKECLPKETQRVEKASIDEVFLDLSAQVHEMLLTRYPELRGPAPYDDPTEPLPRPATTALDWAADALVDLDASQSEEDDPDWDDICMLIASEIVRDLRREIFDQLHYTCSAGLSRNKMLAKLGSGHKKPNSQTVVRNRAVQHFLSGFKFTKIRNLGGKLGDEVVAAFNTDTVSELLPVPIEQLKRQLGDDTGSWLYNVLRGEDHSEVNPRTAIKSMLSAKSFRPSINSVDVACKWLRIFVADIFSRLVEEGVLENKRRPKTINLHHRQGAQTRSRQAPIPMGKQITEDSLFDLAKNLLAQVVVDGRAWPCANLSLSVGGFEDGVTGNKGIGSFLVRGEEAKALVQREDSNGEERKAETPPPGKKRKIEGGIGRFFGTSVIREESDGQVHDDEGDDAHDGMDQEETAAPEDEQAQTSSHIDNHPSTLSHTGQRLPSSPPSSIFHSQHSSEKPLNPGPQSTTDPPLHKRRPYFADPSPEPAAPGNHGEANPEVETYTCPRCSLSIPVPDQSEHEDFHFAKDLQNERSSPPPPPKPPESQRGGGHGKGGTVRRGRGRPPKVASAGGDGARAVEKGQRRLAFG